MRQVGSNFRFLLVAALPLAPLGCGRGQVLLDDGGTINSIAVTCSTGGCSLKLSITLAELEERSNDDDLQLSDFRLEGVELAREGEGAAPAVDDARPEDLDYTTRGERLHVPVLIDQSGSMLVTDPEDERLAGAAAVIDETLGSGGEDLVALLGFPRTESDVKGELGSLVDTDVWHDFSNDPGSLQGALERMADSEGNYTPIYDSIIETAEYMEAELDSEGATRAMVVMTDGSDSESSAQAHHVVDAVSELGIPLYIVALDGPRSTNTAVDYSEIRDMALESGGLFIPSDIDSLRDSLADIANVLEGDLVMTIYLDFEEGSAPLEVGQWYRITGQILYLEDLAIPLDERFYVDQISEE